MTNDRPREDAGTGAPAGDGSSRFRRLSREPSPEEPSPEEPFPEDRPPGDLARDDPSPVELFPGDASSQDPFAREVRRRLHAAVEPLRPAPGALARLRAAVPARRRRRRAAVISAAATFVVLVVAAPVVGSVAGLGGGGGDTVAGEPPRPPGADRTPVGDDTPVPAGPAPGGEPRTRPPVAGAAPGTRPPAGAGPAASGAPSASAIATDGGAGSAAPGTTPQVPPCSAEGLEQAEGTLGPADADGLAYGTVVVRNVSAVRCRVDGPGLVLVASPPGSPPIQVTVLPRRAGDPAAMLPLVPAGGVTVGPGEAYELQFAWRPQAPDGASCAPDGPPAPVPALGYLPERGGTRVAQVTLTAACGGTLHHTEPYPSGAYARAG